MRDCSSRQLYLCDQRKKTNLLSIRQLKFILADLLMGLELIPLIDPKNLNPDLHNDC